MAIDKKSKWGTPQEFGELKIKYIPTGEIKKLKLGIRRMSYHNELIFCEAWGYDKGNPTDLNNPDNYEVEILTRTKKGAEHNQNLHEGIPQSADLSGWLEWAEEIDADGESGFVWDSPLVTVDYVIELLQLVRELKIDTEEFLQLLNNPIKDKEVDSHGK
jgi:hypothetical protein